MNNQTSMLNDTELNLVSGGRLAQLNKKMNRLLNEANDGAAREQAYAKGYADWRRSMRVV
ncbi:hypothetical protein JQ597_34175 [Bradyrhizobium sp. AUGA SZCCT0177]|uniref:hypothetical protein n=1 Tax=Bradyrhizobium sp. AUGA SZCCT0177 TaxID=2807665 RepID=UPI001BA8425F|nr:hypothetical protein [Bradyrhizobium sp. AUGA SZCCT0177]MBR1287114.1 hypothetical protein [Bradyrhizobium sp. AUGA SZCCT0177]